MASYVLNACGMKLYHKCLKRAEKKKDILSLDENNFVIENYDGPFTKDYVGNYSTDGKKYTCSTFKNNHLCRHLVFFRAQSNLPLFDKSMFHKMHNSSAFQEEETFTDSEDESTLEAPGSPSELNMNESLTPGGASIAQDEQVKKLKKAKKWMKGFDVGKVQAEVLSLQSQSTFDKHLKTSKNFLGLLRTGLPEELMIYLGDPENFKVTGSSSSSVVSTSSEVSTLPPKHHEAPISILILLQFDCLVHDIPSDGECFFGALNQHFYGKTEYKAL